MLQAAFKLCLIAGLALLALPGAATPVHRCVDSGAVVYQRDPCPTGQRRAAPTAEQLNAERKKRLDAAKAASAPAAAPAPATAAPPRPAQAAPPAPAAAAVTFRCDGRLHCSQMRSCAEARFFLSNCPGVKMDGDGDGIPCEEQWCGH